MLTRWMKTMIGGVLLFSLTACAESLHQTATDGHAQSGSGERVRRCV